MSRRQPLDQLRRSAPAILPSLLMCDFGNLEREVQRLRDAGVSGLHLDVMDGHFVPNLTYGTPIVRALDDLTDMVLDVHLMISNPGEYIPGFVQAGADIVTIHVEAVEDPRPLLHRIHDLGACTGLACNPDTPLSRVEPYLGACDLVLVMSVQAGFGGQRFNRVAIEKLGYLRSLVADHVLLEVDGGVNASTIQDCAQAGAELFVVGSAIFRRSDYGAAISELQSLANQSTWS